jgi:transposase
MNRMSLIILAAILAASLLLAGCGSQDNKAVNSETGKMSEASLFVSVLTCSQLIYAEPFRDEKLPSWIAGHVHAFLVPDNLKAGVQRPNFYEPDLNKTYQEMATYYGTVILPARVRKPKQARGAKASPLAK